MSVHVAHAVSEHVVPLRGSSALPPTENECLVTMLCDTPKSIVYTLKVLLAKGANKLARNKKGRKPGDVFSPTVDEDKKERIKTMLGMGVAQQDAAPAVPPAAAAQPISSITASTSTAAVATTSVGVAGAGLRGGNGVVDSERGGGTATKSLPPPAFKVTVGPDAGAGSGGGGLGGIG